MIRLRRPTNAALLEALEQVRTAPFTHRPIGSLRGAKPPGYDRDRSRVHLGDGAPVYEAAVSALKAWKMFPSSMVELVAPDLRLAETTATAVLIRTFMIWTFNPCRIAYLIDEQVGETRRFGFAYATLPGHIECGEEHFVCEWNLQSGEVWYEVQADSRPDHWLAQFGYFYARWMQSKFRRESCLAMKAAVLESDLALGRQELSN